MEYKILPFIDQIEASYKEPVTLIDGLNFDQKDTLKTIEFYSNNQYLSGNKDALGREKPFYNVCNYRVTVAKTATDLDLKDIRYEPDTLEHSIEAMLINRELYKYLKESNFSKTLNDMGLTRPKYGGLLVKKYLEEGELDIEVVEWKNVETDPVDILGGTIIETHYLLPSEVAAKSDVWDNVSEVLKLHSKANKGKPARIIIKEVTGEFPFAYDPDEEDTEENLMKFKTMCFYVACVGKKKFFLYKEDLKSTKDKYRYLPWEKVPGRALGRGVVEEGFESQVWTNDAMISIKNAMDLAGKVLLSTDSQKIMGNAITGVDNGHIFQMEPGKTLNSLSLAPTAMPEYHNLIELWKEQYNNSVSVHGANTGEAPTAGTPYSQTALLNQVANTPFEYQREVWGIFLTEILNDWILPHLTKRLKKAHTLVSDFSAEELELIDERFAIFEVNKKIIDDILNGKEVYLEDYQAKITAMKEARKALGIKREIKIPEGFFDGLKGRISANLTGELKNKGAVLQSLDTILRTVMASFNPNTGSYAVLEDPKLSKIFGMLIESAGIPLSFAELKGVSTPAQLEAPTGTSPVEMPDLSAITPVA